jgi:ribosomal protein S21
MVEVKKSENESTAGLIKRFSKKIKESNILNQARDLRFKNRPKSRLSQKKEALKKVRRQKHLVYLRKLGKIE